MTVTEKEIEEPTSVPAEKIELNKSALSLKIGEIAQLEATITPSSATDSIITWVSSDISVATVKKGAVTAVANGECTIIASAGGKDASCKVIVSKGAGNGNNGNSLNINFKNQSDQPPTYTGTALTPAIEVTYGQKALTSGTDYTVKYSNNIKPGLAKITVKGKGNYTSSRTVDFNILQADINNVMLGGLDEYGKLVVVNGSKLNITLNYNNAKLTAKDYSINGDITASQKIYDTDDGKKIIIAGKGNFTGTREVVLKVVDKNSLIKFTAAIDKNLVNNITYDGKAHYIHEIKNALTITGKDGNTDMTYGKDYTIVYPKDVINAGVKRFTVMGMGLYTGSVKKSYTIKPASRIDGDIEVAYEGGDIDNISLPYISTGVTFNDKLKVTYIKGSDTLTLEEGKDYKVTYSGNKKVGNNAKFTISFLNNYKKIPKKSGTFTIEKANLEDAMVIIADKAYTGKAKIYKSVPYVIEAGTNKLLKSSEYTVTYYTDESRNTQMKGKNKVTLNDTVYVKIEAKDKGNYKSDNSIIKSYKIVDASDISKAKVTFMDAGTKDIVKSTEYTGGRITDNEIQTLVNGNSAKEDKDIVVTYVNNINKGKATVIITGTGETGCKYAGCKVANFKITAHRIY